MSPGIRQLLIELVTVLPEPFRNRLPAFDVDLLAQRDAGKHSGTSLVEDRQSADRDSQTLAVGARERRLAFPLLGASDRRKIRTPRPPFRYVELSGRADFNDRFIDELAFPG